MNLDDASAEDVSFRSIVALIYSGNSKLGIAWYDELANAIMVGSLPLSNDGFEDAMAMIKTQCSPSFFLLHPSLVAQSQLLEIVISSQDQNGIVDRAFYSYQMAKSTSWQSESAKYQLQTKLAIRGSAANTAYESFQQLASCVDLENATSMQAVGALMSFLQAKVFNLDDGKMTISSISTFQWKRYLRVDDNTLRSLQIFSEELHPNVIKGDQRSKEGFSLFSLLDRTRSLPGRHKLREWLGKPLCDIDEIRKRHTVIEMLMKIENKELIIEVTKFLRHSHDIARLLLRIKKVEAGLLEWHKLYIALDAALSVCRSVHTFCSDEHRDGSDKILLAELFHKVNVQAIDSSMNMLHNTIDFKLSASEGVITIREGLSDQLDHYRFVINAHRLTYRDTLLHFILGPNDYFFSNIYDTLDERLAIVAREVLELVPNINYVSVDYFPQIGYLVAVSDQDCHLLNSKVHSTTGSVIIPNDCIGDSDRSFSPTIIGNTFRNHVIESDDGEIGASGSRKRTMSDFQFIFKQSGTSYFKHKLVEELDESIGDIRSLILDSQKMILVKVEDALLETETALQCLANAIATLDAFISLAVIATEMRFTKPEIVDTNVVIIKNGRHPLQELTVDNFVPNDTYVTEDKCIALITGPNSSGKSVYLKQVGIMVYLAHVGSFIPCDKAIIGISDRLFTRISSTETSSSPHSAFTLDLCQINRMLHTATSKTICLIDEFGKGTTPVDGIALLAVTIKALMALHSKALCALHFTEILHPEILNSDDMLRINCFRMDFIHSNVEDVRVHLEQQDNRSQSTAANALAEEHTLCAAVTPLFKLRMGVTASSEGIACARVAGVAEDILERALSVKQSIIQRQPIRTASQIPNVDGSLNPQLFPAGLETQQNRDLLKLFLGEASGNNIRGHENSRNVGGRAVSEDVFESIKAIMWA